MQASYVLPKEANGLAGVAFKIWKQRFTNVFQDLQRSGLLNDWRHEAYTIALEAWKAGLRYGDRKLPGFIYNRWYDFLRRYGFFKNGSVRPRYIQGGLPEDLLEKLPQLAAQDGPIPSQLTSQLKKEEKGFRWEYNGQEIYFTAHFLKRWKERILLQFSPMAVWQQMALGETIFSQVLGNGVHKERIKCPWFTMVVVKKRGIMIMITVF